MVLKKKFEKFQQLQVHGQANVIGQPGAAASANVNDQGLPVANVNISYVDMD